MKQSRVNIYVGLMCAAAVACLWRADWDSLWALPVDSQVGLATLIGIALLAEALAIGLDTSGGTSSITFLPLLAAVQLFGPVAGIVLIVPTFAFTDYVVRRKRGIKVVFNAAQVTVSTTLAGAAFTMLGGYAIHGVDDPEILAHLTPFVVFGLIFLAVNHAAVSMAITLSQELPFRRVLPQLLNSSGGQLNDLLVAPLALAVAFLYLQFGLGGVLVIVLPMLFVRYSYLQTAQLREANEDLLTALVKAIETRDPYTSGHSQRVSVLAGKIADLLGLNRRTAERVRMAALLHDIGKIEEVYTEILRKPDALTPEERATIEDHVVRGETLLRDLSSVPEEVVLAVRHHHEREDGRGYPEGLVGSQIPIGAKIIVVCDAVDAMLSDRPYRRALGVDTVLEQLRIHSGTQFDSSIVDAVLGSNIIDRFAESVRRERELERRIEEPPIPLAPSPSAPPSVWAPAMARRAAVLARSLGRPN